MLLKLHARPKMYPAVIIFIPESLIVHVHAHVRTRVTNIHFQPLLEVDLGRKVDKPPLLQRLNHKKLQFEWSYLQRVLPNCDISFAPLHDAINKRFWPSVFGGPIAESQQHLLY